LTEPDSKRIRVADEAVDVKEIVMVAETVPRLLEKWSDAKESSLWKVTAVVSSLLKLTH